MAGEGGEGREGQTEQTVFRAEKILCMTLQWGVHVISHLSDFPFPREHATKGIRT